MPVAMADKFNLLKRMRGVFDNAAKERRKRSEMVEDPLDPGMMTFGWVIHEREQMHAAVNAERVRRGLAPVGLRPIFRADQMAGGHSDYSSKFPLYCTEIALGENEPQP